MCSRKSVGAGLRFTDAGPSPRPSMPWQGMQFCWNSILPASTEACRRGDRIAGGEMSWPVAVRVSTPKTSTAPESSSAVATVMPSR